MLKRTKIDWLEVVIVLVGMALMLGGYYRFVQCDTAPDAHAASVTAAIDSAIAYNDSVRVAAIRADSIRNDSIERMLRKAGVK